MSEFKAIALDMISAPNTFAPLPGNMWSIISPNQQTLWFQLNIVDSLGTRRYIAATGASLTATFRRMDIITSTHGVIGQTNQDVVKTITFNTSDKSLCSMDMTTADVTKLVSGGVLFSLTEGGVVKKWIQDWMVRKTLTDPGF